MNLGCDIDETLLMTSVPSFVTGGVKAFPSCVSDVVVKDDKANTNETSLARVHRCSELFIFLK
jgi:hypothetical protein